MDITAFIVVFIISCVVYVVWSKWIYKYRVHEVANDGIKLFTDLPIGARFKYLDDNRIWVVFENWGKGLIVPLDECEGRKTPYSKEFTEWLIKNYSYRATTYKIRELKKLKVIVVD